VGFLHVNFGLWVKWAGTAVLVGALTGCYLPTGFVAEITIQRTGDYTLTYDGVLLSSNLVPGLLTDDPDQKKIDERLEGVFADMDRDSSYQTVDYLGNGAFQVYFEKSDNIFERTSVTFIRTDNRFLSIAYVRKTGEIPIRASIVPENQRPRLEAIGYSMAGEFRVTTDARVLDNNATGVVEAENGALTYIWVMRGMVETAPLLVIG
jgi:hypothetical protein